MVSKKHWTLFSILFLTVTFFTVVGCSSRNLVVDKTGAQLWGENCIRCHNAPSPVAFSDMQWETITMHMQVRANLTTDESEKIADFLKMAN